MGKYHPHGDQAIYDTLVRMAQPFSLRYPLVDGQGNFGSIDDDPPAAMRYTECRLTRLATEMLRDIDTDTVDFGPNYDESRKRAARRCRRGSRTCSSTAPPGSPSAWRRTCRRTTSARRSTRSSQLIDKPDANVEDLMKHVKGPDFPTGAHHRRPLRASATPTAPAAAASSCAPAPTSRSCAAARARSSSPSCPYGVKKGGDSGVIKKIADLVNEKVITEVSDLADHSDQSGHADPDRAQARRDPAGRAQQALQAHGAADDVRLQRRRARRRRAADAVAARARPALPRLPARGRHPPLEVRAAQGRAARARPRGLPDRARQPRRGDRADPRLRRHRRGARRG